MVGKARAIVVLEDGMGRDQHFDDHIIDFRPHFVDIVAVVQHPFVDGGNATFRSRVFVANEIFGTLLNGVIGQMHEDIFLDRRRETNVAPLSAPDTYTVGVGRFFVLLRGETRQTVFVDEDAKRIARGHGDVDAEIEFETIDEKRLERR